MNIAPKNPFRGIAAPRWPSQWKTSHVYGRRDNRASYRWRNHPATPAFKDTDIVSPQFGPSVSRLPV